MKSQNTSRGNMSGGYRHQTPRIPLEWKDSMSWRLPSGKALAEFALQAGFLAPVILSAATSTRKQEARESGSSSRETR